MFLYEYGAHLPMTDEVTREEIADRLGNVKYNQFLMYLMGPYKSFNLEYVLSDTVRKDVQVADLPPPIRRLFRPEEDIDEAEALLRRVQGALRTDPGVNAFLALDIGVEIKEMDAVTQSIEYAQLSNVAAFVVPFLGHNFGVGEEAGSILENITEMDGERLLFIHEEDVTSAMIRSAKLRWNLRVETYNSEAELVAKLREFAGGIMHRERRGELSRLD